MTTSSAALRRHRQTLFKINIIGKRWVLKESFLTWWQRPKVWMGGGEIFGEDEISVSKFKFPPQIFGGGLLGANAHPKMAGAHKAATVIVAADECRHLLVCFAMYPRWAPVASFA